jgi:DNA-binding transcriptional MerR regulator
MVIDVGDVASAFGVDKKTVRRWEESGEIPKAGRTLKGNARRWPASVVAALLVAQGLPVPASWGVAVAA